MTNFVNPTRLNLHQRSTNLRLTLYVATFYFKFNNFRSIQYDDRDKNKKKKHQATIKTYIRYIARSVNPTLRGHLLLRNLPCSSPRGSRSSLPIFGPVFSWTKSERGTVRSLSNHAETYRRWLNQTKCEWSYLQHAVALPFKQATVAETTTIRDWWTLSAGCCFEASWGDVPAVFIGQSVQGDCSLTAGAFEETFYRVVPPEVMILLHASIRRLEVSVIALEI